MLFTLKYFIPNGCYCNKSIVGTFPDVFIKKHLKCGTKLEQNENCWQWS